MFYIFSTKRINVCTSAVVVAAAAATVAAKTAGEGAAWYFVAKFFQRFAFVGFLQRIKKNESYV